MIKEVDKVLFAKERGKDKGFYLNRKANFRIGDLVERAGAYRISL